MNNETAPMRNVRSFIIILSLLFGITSCHQDPDVLPNAVPIADAGPAKTITLPTNTVTLSGSGTDNDGDVVAYLWSQVSGPNATVIVNPGSATTVVDGFIEGAYIFQLMVTDDDGATGVDTTLVTVNPAVEQTVTLQPANNPNDKMLVTIGGVDYSGINTEMVIDAWTVNGDLYIGRNAFKFDLSSIPTNSTIVSANLYLYSNTPPQNGNLMDANFGTSNSLLLQQITSNWSPATANWFNQPTVTTTNQVVIPHTTQSVLDLDIDVTNMIGVMVNSNANYGFLLRLENEVIYNSRMFVSSHHATKISKHPKLVIVYQ